MSCITIADVWVTYTWINYFSHLTLADYVKSHAAPNPCQLSEAQLQFLWRRILRETLVKLQQPTGLFQVKQHWSYSPESKALLNVAFNIFMSKPCMWAMWEKGIWGTLWLFKRLQVGHPLLKQWQDTFSKKTIQNTHITKHYARPRKWRGKPGNETASDRKGKWVKVIPSCKAKQYWSSCLNEIYGTTTLQ